MAIIQVASQAMLAGNVLQYCLDCGEEIAAARRIVAIKAGHKCEYCIDCQPAHDERPKNQDVGPNPLVDICAGWCIMNYIN